VLPLNDEVVGVVLLIFRLRLWVVADELRCCWEFQTRPGPRPRPPLEEEEAVDVDGGAEGDEEMVEAPDGVVSDDETVEEDAIVY
jgi:hypothetical protein